MLEIRNRETLQSKVNICKSDVKIGDYADSLARSQIPRTESKRHYIVQEDLYSTDLHNVLTQDYSHTH